MAQLGVAALDKGWAIAGEPRLDLSHACSPECINTYGLVSITDGLSLSPDKKSVIVSGVEASNKNEPGWNLWRYSFASSEL